MSNSFARASFVSSIIVANNRIQVSRGAGFLVDNDGITTISGGITPAVNAFDRKFPNVASRTGETFEHFAKNNESNQAYEFCVECYNMDIRSAPYRNELGGLVNQHPNRERATTSAS